MKPIDKLRIILCTVPEIKDNLWWLCWKDVCWCYETTEWHQHPIQERHLRMYCEEKRLEFEIYHWELSIIEEWEDRWFVLREYNDTKDFQDQSDEVIESIVKFLEN